MLGLKSMFQFFSYFWAKGYFWKGKKVWQLFSLPTFSLFFPEEKGILVN